MDQSDDQHDVATDELRPFLTIEERIAKGRETGHHYDGAIVPFPPSVKREGILSQLKQGERRWVEQHIAGGYRMTAFDYRSTAGEIIQSVLRFDHRTEPKQIRPVRYCGEFEDKGRVFWMTSIEGPRPLYRLDALAHRPNAPVLVVEGEKTCEAAALLFPDHVVMTWMSGAQNVRHTEMIQLRGRELTLWPDNDPPGRGAMRMFASMAYQAGAASVKMVDVPKELGEKWDLADAVPSEAAAGVDLVELVATARLIAPGDVAHLISDDRQRAEQRRLLGHQPGYTLVKPEDVALALSVLDSDMFGNEWRRLARCIYYALGDKGCSIFDAWSKESEHKYRDGEPAKLWAAYKTEPAFRGDSLAWLFRKAQRRLNERSEAGVGDQANIVLNAKAVVTASVEELNEDHAVVVRGGKTGVLWENFDPRFGRYTETYLSHRDFADRFVRRVALPADDERQTKKQDKSLPQGALWFGSNLRRAYDGVHFAPGADLGPTFLNNWRGFTVESKDDPAGRAKLKEHLLHHVLKANKLATIIC